MSVVDGIGAIILFQNSFAWLWISRKNFFFKKKMRSLNYEFWMLTFAPADPFFQSKSLLQWPTVCCDIKNRKETAIDGNGTKSDTITRRMGIGFWVQHKSRKIGDSLWKQQTYVLRGLFPCFCKSKAIKHEDITMIVFWWSYGSQPEGEHSQAPIQKQLLHVDKQS